MAAPSFSAPLERAVRDRAAEATLTRLRDAAALARDRLAEIDGVRVIGPEVASGSADVRLALDLRDTGRDAWEVACAMAGRGFALDAASHRVIVVRLGEHDRLEGVHHRLAPALELALWTTPAQR